MESDDNSDSGKEEEDDDDDANKAQLTQMLDQQKKYLQMCQTSAKILQVLAGLGAPPSAHIIELESVSDDTDVSSCSSPEESTSQASNTEDTSRPESERSAECVIWAEPLLTCQLVNSAPRPCRDVRRLPPGVTPDDVKRSKAEAAKAREAAAATSNNVYASSGTKTITSAQNNCVKDGQSHSEQKHSGADQTAKTSVLPGDTHSKPSSSNGNTDASLSSKCTEIDKPATNAEAHTSNKVRTETDGQQTSVLPTAAAVSSSLAATREDFKRAMTQITCASETIRQAHSLLTSMGLGHYSLRRRLAQINNNNNPETTDETGDPANGHQDAFVSAAQQQDTNNQNEVEEQSDPETNHEDSVSKESVADTTENTVESGATFPPLVMVKPINDAEGNMHEELDKHNKNSIGTQNAGEEFLQRQKDYNKRSDCNRPETSKSLANEVPKLNSNISNTSSTGSNNFYNLSSRRNINVSANVPKFRDVCLNTDSWGKWSSHLQRQRQQTLSETSRVTRFTNRFNGLSMFNRHALLPNRTQESTNLATNTQSASAMSPINEVNKGKSFNPHEGTPTASTELVSNSASQSLKRMDIQNKDTTDKKPDGKQKKVKHKITLREVKKAVDFAQGTLRKSGKWTESWNSERDGKTETKISTYSRGSTNETHCQISVEKFCPTLPDLDTTVRDEMDSEGKGTRTECTGAKRVTFSQEPMVITRDNTQSSNCGESVSEDTVCDTHYSSDCLTSHGSSSDSIASIDPTEHFATDENYQEKIENCCVNETVRSGTVKSQTLPYQSSNGDLSIAADFNLPDNANILTASSPKELVPLTLGRCSSGQGDTPEDADIQSKPTYFDRLKEVHKNQSHMKAKTDIVTPESDMFTESKAALTFRVYEPKILSRETQEETACNNKGKDSTPFENDENMPAHHPISAVPLHPNTKSIHESNKMSENADHKITMSAETKTGENCGLITGKEEKTPITKDALLASLDGVAENMSLDYDAKRDQWVVGLHFNESNLNRKETAVDANANGENSEPNKVTHMEHEQNVDASHETGIHYSASESVLQTESSAAADATFTFSNSTVDHVLVYVDEEEEEQSLSQIIKVNSPLGRLEKDSQDIMIKGTMQRISVDKVICVLEGNEYTNSGKTTPRSPLETETKKCGSCDYIICPQFTNKIDQSTSLSIEEPLYNRRCNGVPSNTDHDDSLTLTSSVEKVSVTECEPSLSLDCSLSAGDMLQTGVPERATLPTQPSASFCSGSPRYASRQADSLPGPGGRKHRNRINSSKYHRVKPSPRTRPSSDSALGGKYRLYQSGDDLSVMTATSHTPLSLYLARQKHSRSCGNSPRSERLTSTSKWGRFTPPAKINEQLSPAHSSSAVSVIEMIEEEKKSESLIFPEPLQPEDPFGIRQSSDSKASADFDPVAYPDDPQVKVKVAGGSSADSDDESLCGARGSLSKGPAKSFFSRPRRLRFRRRRRRHRQQPRSWWTRSVRCVRSKLRSLFRVCFK